MKIVLKLDKKSILAELNEQTTDNQHSQKI